MQNAETVLDVLRQPGRRGLPCTELYRQLFNPDLYLMAYGRLYSNHGAMTPGVDGETADGMTTGRIGRIIEAMRHERYRFHTRASRLLPKKHARSHGLRPGRGCHTALTEVATYWTLNATEPLWPSPEPVRPTAG
jgi:retron-type reverse transcriptase